MRANTHRPAWGILTLAPILAASPALAINYAVLVGVDYAPADQKWAVDANNVQARLAADPNWAAGNIRLICGTAGTDVTRAGILDAIALYALAAAPGDGFFFYYSGHGSYFRDPAANWEDPGEGPSPPRDWPDESLWIQAGPAGRVGDDDLVAAFEAFRAGVKKLTFLDSCFAGGFWNGESAASPNGGDLGDLENLAGTTLIGAADEQHTAPGSSDISNNFVTYLTTHQFDLDSMGQTQLAEMYNRIRVNQPVLGQNRKGDPNWPDPDTYDPLSFTSPEDHDGGSVFCTNIPEPGLLMLLLVGGLLASRRRSRI